jgi:hypothetical protein
MGPEGSWHIRGAAPTSKKRKSGKKRSKGVVEPIAQEYTALSGETESSEGELRWPWIKFNALGKHQVGQSDLSGRLANLSAGSPSKVHRDRIALLMDLCCPRINCPSIKEKSVSQAFLEDWQTFQPVLR